MKKYFLLTAFLLPVFISNALGQQEKEPYLVTPLSGKEIKNVKAQTSGGSIYVSGVNSDARIEVYVVPNNRKEFSKEEIRKKMEDEYALDVSVSGDRLVAIATSKKKMNDWKNALIISFRIFVPQHVSTDLTTSGGSISLENVSGNHDFTTSGGSLNVNKVSGKVTGRTSGGSINLQDSQDEIELVTSGGNIHATNSKGNVRLTTSGGSLMLEGLKGNIKATTSGGNIKGNDIAGELFSFTSGGNIQFSNLSCSLETGTSGGNVAIAFLSLGKYVKVSTSSGSIDLQLPKEKGLDLDLTARKIRTGHLENFSGTLNEETIDGKLNGGGVPVTVKAEGGSINLALK
jgi:hypothetical protein